MTVDASNSRAKTHCAKGGFPDLQAGLLDLANLASQKGLRERGQPGSTWWAANPRSPGVHGLFWRGNVMDLRFSSF